MGKNVVILHTKKGKKTSHRKKTNKLRHKQGSNNQGAAPRLSQHLKVIRAWEKLNGLDTEYSVDPGPALFFPTSLHQSFFQDSWKPWESLQHQNIFSATLIHTSAFLKPVPTVNPLTFLLLADLNVLLNVYSWRGRDRHSWKHTRPQIQAGQRKTEKRGWSGAEQNKTTQTSMNGQTTVTRWICLTLK